MSVSPISMIVIAVVIGVIALIGVAVALQSPHGLFSLLPPPPGGQIPPEEPVIVLVWQNQYNPYGAELMEWHINITNLKGDTNRMIHASGIGNRSAFLPIADMVTIDRRGDDIYFMTEEGGQVSNPYEHRINRIGPDGLGGRVVYVVDNDTRNGPYNPLHFSLETTDDGGTIAFFIQGSVMGMHNIEAFDHRIEAVEADGSNHRVLYAYGLQPANASPLIETLFASVSGDGRTLVFKEANYTEGLPTYPVEFNWTYEDALYRLDLATGVKTKIYSLGVQRSNDTVTRRVTNPRISADGRRVLFLETEKDQSFYTQYLKVMNRDGTGVRTASAKGPFNASGSGPQTFWFRPSFMQKGSKILAIEIHYEFLDQPYPNQVYEMNLTSMNLDGTQERTILWTGRQVVREGPFITSFISAEASY
ncbi:MAG: hypothetical protein HY520_01635 [Candidatus Aenigmarchaeota archaeon]|nr:hypothetical protein [Candidatus Aenigmarchaeota archaeon]